MHTKILKFQNPYFVEEISVILTLCCGNYKNLLVLAHFLDKEFVKAMFLLKKLLNRLKICFHGKTRP